MGVWAYSCSDRRAYSLCRWARTPLNGQSSFPGPALSDVSPLAEVKTPSPEAVPSPIASAFALANTYTYGQAPTNAYARPSDPVKIFYASFGPTLLRDGTTVNVSALTTTNVQRTTLMAGGAAVPLTQEAPGKWRATYQYSASGLSADTVRFELIAERGDGNSARIPIQVNIPQ